MPTASKSLHTKKRQSRTSEQLEELEKAFRSLKKAAKFQENHPKTLRALLGIASVGLLIYLGKRK